MTQIPIDQQPSPPHNRVLLLPTRRVIDEITQKAHAIGLYDYDLDEMLMHIFNALRWKSLYPRSAPNLVTSGFTEEERQVWESMMSDLYHRIFKILCDTNSYDVSGELKWLSFKEYKGDHLLEMV